MSPKKSFVKSICGRTILVIDPDPQFTARLRIELERHGAHTVVAHNLDKGIALAALRGISAAVIGRWGGTNTRDALCCELLRNCIPFASIPSGPDTGRAIDQSVDGTRVAPPNIQEAVSVLIELADVLALR